MTVRALGLNFSHRHAEALGLDAQEAFHALLIHLRPSHLRLSLYWDETAPQPGSYDRTTLRWYLDEAQRRDCRVLLTVGLKPQRHPAYFPPRWLDAGTSAPAPSGRLAANLLLMLERVIALLADYDAIDAWEVEHLPFLPPAEQPPGWSIDATLLQREVSLLHDVDPRHRPVVVSHASGSLVGSAWYQALLTGDVLGYVVGVGRSARAGGAAFSRWQRWQLFIQTTLAARVGKPVWITELVGDKTEGTGGATEQPPRLERDLEAAFRAGVARVYVRGVEEWFATRAQGRAQAWEHARALVRSAAEQLS
jgi:hypothetical protein